MQNYTIQPSRIRGVHYDLQHAMEEVYQFNWDVQPVQNTEFHMVIKSVPMGEMNLSQSTLTQARVTNCAHPSGETPDHPYHLYILNRRQKVITNKRTVILEPGDFTLADSALATTTVTNEPYAVIGLTVPANLLRMYVPHPDSAVGARFSGRTGLSKIVSCMLLTMWELAEADRLSEVEDKLACNLLELFSVCCKLKCQEYAEFDQTSVVKLEKIKQLIDSSLRNPGLNVSGLAEEIGVSSRYLQRLFAEDDYTITRYIRNKRLEGCRQQLADPSWLNHNITDIAFSWGFNSSAHFSRVFKEQYDMSARDFRKRALKNILGIIYSEKMDD